MKQVGSKYEIRKVIDKTKIGNKDMYKVLWKGFPDHEYTYESLQNLIGHQQKVKDFQRHMLFLANQPSSRTNSLQQALRQPSVLQSKSNNEWKFQTGKFNEPIRIPDMRRGIREKGDFEVGDSVKQVVRIVGRNGSLITFAVRWEARVNGTVPEQSEVTNEQLKTYCPQTLLDYYQRHLQVLG